MSVALEGQMHIWAYDQLRTPHAGDRTNSMERICTGHIKQSWAGVGRKDAHAHATNFGLSKVVIGWDFDCKCTTLTAVFSENGQDIMACGFTWRSHCLLHSNAGKALDTPDWRTTGVRGQVWKKG